MIFGNRLFAIIMIMLIIVVFTGVTMARETIEVWVGHDSWVPYLEHFNASQDEYEIEYMIQGSKETFLAAMAAGNPPDVFRTGSMLDLASLGVLMELDTFIERDQVDLSAFIPGILHSLQWEGNTYALPLNGDSHLLFYNIDQFEATGLNPDAPPATWSELETVARQLNIMGSDGNWARIGFSWWDKRTQLDLLLHQKLDSVFNEDLTDIVLDTPETREVVEWIVNSQNQINQGNDAVDQMLANYSDDRSEAFVNGALSTRIGPPAIIAQAERDAPGMQVGVFPLPIAEGGKRTSVSGGHRVVIPIGARNPEGAWAFIKWLTSFEAGMQFAEPGFTQQYIDMNYQGIGQSMSARIDVNLESPFYRTTPLWHDFAQDMIYAIDMPVHPVHEEVLTALADQVERSLDGEISPGEAVEQASHEAKTLLSTWQGQ